MNTPAHEVLVKEARRTAKERDKNAFQPKFDPESPSSHARGCRCRNVGCLKKYCECFNAGIRCGANCGCQDCKNSDGHPELLRVLGVEPSAKRVKFGEDSMSASIPHLMYPMGTAPGLYAGGLPSARASVFDKSLERSTLPAWLKGILITGADRELVKAITNPIMSNILGITTTRRRTAAEIILDEYLTTMEYKEMAIEMVTAARKANDDVLSGLIAQHEGKKKDEKDDKQDSSAENPDKNEGDHDTSANGTNQMANGDASSEPSVAKNTSSSTSSSTTITSNNLSTSLELESPAPNPPPETSDSPFAYLTHPTFNIGIPPRLGIRDYQETAEHFVDVAQEAALLKILEARLRLMTAKVVRNEAEKSKEKAMKAAALKKEEEHTSDMETDSSSPEPSVAAGESSNSSSRESPPLGEQGSTQPLGDGDSPHMEEDES